MAATLTSRVCSQVINCLLAQIYPKLIDIGVLDFVPSRLEYRTEIKIHLAPGLWTSICLPESRLHGGIFPNRWLGGTGCLDCLIDGIRTSCVFETFDRCVCKPPGFSEGIDRVTFLGLAENGSSNTGDRAQEISGETSLINTRPGKLGTGFESMCGCGAVLPIISRVETVVERAARCRFVTLEFLEMSVRSCATVLPGFSRLEACMERGRACWPGVCWESTCDFRHVSQCGTHDENCA